MRLQRRLSATMALLLVVGLAVADLATYTSLRSFLFGRLDEQLDVAQQQAYNYLVFLHRAGHPVTQRGVGSHISSDVYVLVLGPNGKVVVKRPSGSSTAPDPQPALAQPLRAAPGLRPLTFGRHQGTYRPSPYSFEAPAVGDANARYRVEAVAVPQGVVVTAVSMNPARDTLSSLLKVELSASVVIVLALLVLGLWTVRRGLRPLEDMTRTAGAIASGDLTRRVPTTDSSTEVGRLGVAMNTMLSQIEAAFDEKSISEGRLRQFVADASHELRTPLTSIRGYAELLRKGGFPDEESRQRALSRIEQEAERMGGLVDDLLLLARLDQGRPLRAERVDLGDVARDVVEDARAVDPDRLVELRCAPSVLVVGDHHRLDQVAHNLVRNALVHTPAGTPVLVEVSREGEMGVLRVTDRGPGLKAAQLSQVFDRFFRGDAARSRGGTGLGLAIVRAIAEALGGSASAESEPGQGSVFTVRIPQWSEGAPVALNELPYGGGRDGRPEDSVATPDERPAPRTRESSPVEQLVRQPRRSQQLDVRPR